MFEGRPASDAEHYCDEEQKIEGTQPKRATLLKDFSRQLGVELLKRHNQPWRVHERLYRLHTKPVRTTVVVAHPSNESC